MDHSNDINNNIASAYLKMLRGEVEEVEEHHEKDADGNPIPHDDEINEDNTNDKSDDGDGMDKVQPKALKKKFKNRKDKDIDNDGDEDGSDEYLHNRRKTVSKAIDKDDESDEPVAKTDRRKKLDKKDGDADMEAEGYGKKMKKEELQAKLDGADLYEKMDIKQKDRLDDLLNDLSYGHSSYPYDDNAPDPDKVQGMIRKEFGSKIADQVKAYYDKKGSKTGQKLARQRDDSLKRTPTRVSKSGKANKQDVANLKKAIKGIGMPGLQRKGTLKFEAVEQARPGTKAQQRAFDKADKTAKPKDKVSLKPMPASLSRKMKEDKKPSYLMRRIQEKANHVPQDETRDSFDKQVAGRRLTKTFNNELESQMTEQEFVDMHNPKNADVPEFTNAPVVHAKTFKSFKDSVKAGPKRSGDNDQGDKNVINPVNRNT